MFTGLEIKTEKLEKRIYSPKTNNKPLHVNVIYFMKYNYTFQNPKNYRGECHSITILQISLMFGLIEDS